MIWTLLVGGLLTLGSPLWATGGGGATQEQSPAPAQAPEPAVAPQTPTAQQIEALEEESARRAEALERQLEELAREREELTQSLRELDERTRQANAARQEEDREREQRLREVQERLDRAEREAEVEREQNVEDSRLDRDDDGWVEKARAKDPNEKFGFGSTVKVRSKELVGDVVVIAGGAKIDGDVLGDVTAFGGSIKIDGRVSGDVTAFGHDVELGPHARVEGNVNSIGGQIREHSGSYVGGSRGGGSASFDFDDFEAFDNRRVSSFFGWADWVQFFWALIFTGFLCVLAGVVYLILQRPVERVRDVALNSPVRSLVTGFLVLVLSIPALVAVMVVLAISIVGIPFLVILVILLPFALIAFIIATFYGYTAIALGFGGLLRSQLRLGWSSGLALLVVGIISLRALGLSGDLLDAIGLPGFLTMWFGFAGFAVQLIAVSMAIGAVITSKFGLEASASSGFVPPPDLPPVPEFDDDVDDEFRVGVELDGEEDLDDWMSDPADRRPERD